MVESLIKYSLGGGIWIAEIRVDNTRMLRLNIILDMLIKRNPYGGVNLAELKERCGASERSIGY